MAETIYTPEPDTAHADRSPFRLREQNFERVMRILNAKIEGADPYWSIPALARKFLFCERAARDVADGEIMNELQNLSARHVSNLMEAPPRTFGEIALKLAVVIAAEPADTGTGITEQQYGLLTSALAEMVILGERELPEIGALSALTAEDLEWHDPEGDGEAEQ